MNVPGITAYHAIITPNCRVVQGGDEGAFDEAVRRMRLEYLATVAGRGLIDDAHYHLILTVEADTAQGE